MYITNLYVVLNIDNIQGCGCECSVTESVLSLSLRWNLRQYCIVNSRFFILLKNNFQSSAMLGNPGIISCIQNFKL